jgi:hypothetical protein
MLKFESVYVFIFFYDVYHESNVSIGSHYRSIILNLNEQETLEKKAGYAEKMKNKIALLHREAEEKLDMAEAKHGEEVLEAEEMAAKYCATGLAPKKIWCFRP